jgi:hypothetical protein
MTLNIKGFLGNKQRTAFEQYYENHPLEMISTHLRKHHTMDETKRLLKASARHGTRERKKRLKTYHHKVAQGCAVEFNEAVLCLSMEYLSRPLYNQLIDNPTLFAHRIDSLLEIRPWFEDKKGTLNNFDDITKVLDNLRFGNRHAYKHESLSSIETLMGMKVTPVETMDKVLSLAHQYKCCWSGTPWLFEQGKMTLLDLHANDEHLGTLRLRMVNEDGVFSCDHISVWLDNKHLAEKGVYHQLTHEGLKPVLAALTAQAPALMAGAKAYPHYPEKATDCSDLQNILVKVNVQASAERKKSIKRRP